MRLVEAWHCLGGYADGIGQVPCDAHGGPHRDAEKHLRTTGHSVVLTATATTTAPAPDAGAVP